MDRSRIALLCLLLLPASPASAEADETWQRADEDIGESAFVAVASDLLAPARILAASRHVVYVSDDGGLAWQGSWRVPAATTLSRVAISPWEPPGFFALTDHGLYGSFDGGARWSRVFRGVGEGEAQCTTIAFNPHQSGGIALGTRGGLFISPDRGHRWVKLRTPSGSREIVGLAFSLQDADRLYLLTASNLFVGSPMGGRWEPRFTLIQTPEPATEEAETTEANDSEPAPAANQLRDVTLHPQHPATLYLAASRGVQASTDRGLTWQPLPRSGLDTAAVARLLFPVSSPVLWAATSHSIARYEPDRERWMPIATGLPAARVNDLTATPTHVWAATDRGLYRLEHAPSDSSRPSPPSARELFARISFPQLKFNGIEKCVQFTLRDDFLIDNSHDTVNHLLLRRKRK